MILHIENLKKKKKEQKMIRVDKQVNPSCKREFSDGPLIRTPSFPWGRRFHPGWGTQIQQAT